MCGWECTTFGAPDGSLTEAERCATGGAGSGNASKLVGYGIQPDGSLEEVASASIPYNSPMGLTGF